MTGAVLVTGASGALGPVVVRAFQEAGYRTRALCRSVPAAGLLPADCEVRSGDIADRRFVSEAVSGMDVVVHMAALLHLANPPAALLPEYERVNVEGTGVLADAVTAAGVARLVAFSTITVYGPGNGRTLDETSAPNPQTPYAKSKLAAERIVLERRGTDGAPLAVVLRLAAAYGPRTKGNYARLIRALSQGRFIPVGQGENRRTLVHESDAGAAAILAARHPEAPGNVFNVTDGEVHTVEEIIGAISHALGRRPPKFSLPAGLAGLALGAVEKASGLLGVRAPATRAMLRTYQEDVAVSGDLIRRRLGYSARVDLKAGWTSAIAEMRRSGQL